MVEVPALDRAPWNFFLLSKFACKYLFFDRLTFIVVFLRSNSVSAFETLLVGKTFLKMKTNKYARDVALLVFIV